MISYIYFSGVEVLKTDEEQNSDMNRRVKRFYRNSAQQVFN